METLSESASLLQTYFKQLPTQAELIELAKHHQKDYHKAAPYPHIVLDTFFQDTFLDQVLEEFPSPQARQAWAKYENEMEAKLQLSGEEQWGPATRFLMHYLNAQPFLSFLETLTGIKDLIPDPHFQGGGLHQTVRGGYLKVHADFNKNPKTHLDRRLNVLVYLNKDWDASYGGAFEMWDREMTGCVKQVPPLFNRVVVFSTTDYSFHGLPNPLTCPEGRSRKSLALYYYTNGRPDAEKNEESHATLWQLRPGDEQAQLQKKLDQIESRNRRKRLVKSLIPPILYDALRKRTRRDI